MTSLFTKLLDRFFQHREIVNCDRDLYLNRWYIIRTKCLGIFVHQFVRSDEDRALHDHPWSFIVIPIWRGYIEHSVKRCRCVFCLIKEDEGERSYHDEPIQRRVWPIIGARCRPATYRHRVELIECECAQQTDPYTLPCKKCGRTGFKSSWSIFIRFRSIRDWGFWMPNGFVQWAQFWKEKCE